jgi:digeranylgeranylglycerophospholipid reductase
MKDFDVIVIGAGPTGSTAAMTAAGLGLSVLLLERDNTVGSPVRCAEGVDHKGLSEFFEPDPKWIAATITRYSLVAPDGTDVEMNIYGNRGYILERLIFDRMIAEKAAENGALVLTGTEAYRMSGFENGFRTVWMRNGDGEKAVRGRVIIAADGVESRVAKWAGIVTACSVHDMETCAQVTVAGENIEDNIFKMYFTCEFAPGGYGWVFPKGKGKANIGLGISGDFTKRKSPKRYLDEFLRHHFPDCAVISRTFGGNSCTGGIKKIYTDGVMVAGDSAHMANPVTGGGIINGMIAGKIAGESASEVLKKGTANENALKAYGKRFDDRIGNMNRRFYHLKEGILDIPDERFNEIAHEIISLPIEKRTPIRVLKSALFKKPDLLLVLAKVVL